MQKFRFILLAAFLLVVIVSCSESRFDYRHKYVGDYELEVEEEMVHNSGYGGRSHYNFQCKVDFSESKDSLIFDFYDIPLFYNFFPQLVIAIDKDGKVILIKAPGLNGLVGEFTDKEHFSITLEGSDSNRQFFRDKIEATRK